MIQSKFLRNKIQRQIKQNGIEAILKKCKEDQYHQIVEDDVEITFNCIFHTTNSFIKSTAEDAAKTVTKPQPMILCLFEDGEQIEVNDKIKINDNEFFVVDKNNLNEFNVAFDISLELIK